MDWHESLPRGRNLSTRELAELGTRLFHVSLSPVDKGRVLRSRDYEERPHYEFFREVPRPEFLEDSNFVLYRQLEATFENVRKAIARGAPSRRSAIFVFPCLECATWFRDRSRKEGIIIELSPLPSSTVFIADLVWRNVATNVLRGNEWQEPDFPFRVDTKTDALRRIAEAYWGAEDPRPFGLVSRPEMLIDGEAVVIGQALTL